MSHCRPVKCDKTEEWVRAYRRGVSTFWQGNHQHTHTFAIYCKRLSEYLWHWEFHLLHSFSCSSSTCFVSLHRLYVYIFSSCTRHDLYCCTEEKVITLVDWNFPFAWECTARCQRALTKISQVVADRNLNLMLLTGTCWVCLFTTISLLVTDSAL